MNPQQAQTLIIDCGTMVGHQQTELELVQETIPFFGLSGSATSYLNMRLSNGLIASFRAVYRQDNGMWRIELSDAIPEIRDGVIPSGTRRSNYAAVFTKIGTNATADYDLQLILVGSPEYDDHLATADAASTKHRTQAGSHGRNYGWY